jgi:hypothetical protein
VTKGTVKFADTGLLDELDEGMVADGDSTSLPPIFEFEGGLDMN